MTSFKKKVYKGLPVKVLVRKPRYYYQDILKAFDEKQTCAINLVEFEGVEYEVGEYFVLIKDKMLWNRKMCYETKRCFAPNGNEYLVIVDDKIEKMKGCLDGVYDDGVGRSYVAFVKRDDFILTTNKDEVAGYYYGGEVNVLAHEVKNYIELNFTDDENLAEYSLGDDNYIYVSLGQSAKLLLKDYVSFDFVPENPYFGYEIRCMAKVIPSDATGTRKLFVFDNGDWFGTSGGKLCFYNYVSADEALSANQCYWVKLSEVFVNGGYVLRIGYVEDNGYTYEELLDDSLWTSVSVELEGSYLANNVCLKSLGSDDGSSVSWSGKIGLKDTRIDFISNGNSEAKWLASVKV